ncbi:MAG TPA: uroporphyrinogen-III C-methyltransferase, partial [Spirochaetota bacterium]|nr:uroporphyrinogen-III C-methyltransferase [Spirochaetota bacterium]
MKGIVYLVGAGPGDPELISIKGKRLLQEADCVIYDYLAEKSLVSDLRCELIYVGKQGSNHTMTQDEINSLMLSKALEGKKVVRLKGGDPFIFGRGGEEAEELAKAGIPFVVVPGISSFYSAPAYAGIPVTHRDFANAFEVISGHRRDD